MTGFECGCIGFLLGAIVVIIVIMVCIIGRLEDVERDCKRLLGVDNCNIDVSDNNSDKCDYDNNRSESVDKIFEEATEEEIEVVLKYFDVGASFLEKKVLATLRKKLNID